MYPCMYHQDKKTRRRGEEVMRQRKKKGKICIRYKQRNLGGIVLKQFTADSGSNTVDG